MEAILRKYLKKYKQDLLPIALTVASIILVVRVLIPQFNGILEFRDDLQAQVATNDGLRESINTLNSISNIQLEEDYNLVLSTLPVSKSIGSIYSALSSAASESNVTIGSLNLQVGSIYSTEEVPERKVEGVPFLNLLVRVNGQSASDAQKFAQTLYEKLPINEINSISATDTDGSYDVDFFFKPLNTNSFQAQTRLQPLTPSHQELLTTLRSWSE